MADESRPMTGFELESAFKLLVATIGKMPVLLSRELSQVAEDGMCDATSRVARVLEAVKQFEVTLKAKADEIGTLYEELWRSTEEKNVAFRKRLESLPTLPEVKVPFNIKELISIAEKCQGLSDVAWQRVVELAKALAEPKS